MSNNAQETKSSFNPFGRYNELMSKMFEEQVNQAQTVAQELQKASATNVKNVQVAMEDASKLMKTTMEYQAGLFQEMQKLSMDAMRQMMPKV